MTSDGTNSYSWDAENRLLQITYPGTGNNSQFSYDGYGECTKILEYTSSSLTSTKQFVWSGERMREARNAAGAITSQYFAEGQTISGSNYFLTRDHLLSIREMTDSSGTIQAQYNYDPFGRTIKLQGSLASDFEFAGYYSHSASGLSLTLMRAYNPQLGRWISRDPIEEEAGTNMFIYVNERPTELRDPYGLKDMAGQGAKIGHWCGDHFTNNTSKWSETDDNMPRNGGLDPKIPFDHCCRTHDFCLNDAAKKYPQNNASDNNNRKVLRCECDRVLLHCLNSFTNLTVEQKGLADSITAAIKGTGTTTFNCNGDGSLTIGPKQ